jgi:hypothetical protein
MGDATEGSSASDRPSIPRQFDGLIDEGFSKKFRRRISTLRSDVQQLLPPLKALIPS